MWINRMIDISTLTEEQREKFITEVVSRRKNIVKVMLLTFFLGGIGAHKFYFKENKKGVMYLLFCWTFIPTIISYFELPVVRKRVEDYNDQLALEVVAKIKAMG